MNKFTKGQEIWLLEEPSILRKSIDDCIMRCVYNEVSLPYRVKNTSKFQPRHHITLIFNGKLGLSRDVNDHQLFETLEDLKKHLIRNKINEVNDLQSQINNINNDIKYIGSLRDIKEDRERNLNTILKF